MPKDDASVHPASHSHGQAAPLKRGDACLYCRKRRIKCSAEKPTCAHCAKLGRECVYDSGKPVSRVRQLEEKVAQLENLLTTSTPASSAGSGGGGSGGGAAETSRHHAASHPPPLAHHASSGQSTSSAGSAAGASHMPYPSANGQTAYEMANAQSQPDGFLDIHMFDDLGGAGPSCLTPGFLASFGGSVFNGPSAPSSMGTGMGTGQTQQTSGQELFDFSLLDPDYTSLLSSFSATTTSAEPTYNPPLQASSSQQQPFPHLHQQQQQQPLSQAQAPTTSLPANRQSVNEPPLDAMDMFMVGQPSDTPFKTNSYYSQAPIGMVGPNAGKPGFVPFSELQSTETRQSSAEETEGQNTWTSIPYHAYVTDMNDNPAPAINGTNKITPLRPHPESLKAREGDPVQWILGITESSPDSQPAGVGTTPASQSNANGQEGQSEADAFTLVGGWFDAADLPKVARDHLLDLFFGQMRLFGQEFHIPRFYASLALPPSKRPHPCLLYAIYLIASRISTSPAIRALEQHFYSIACKQLDESIGRADRLLDAVRAATILAVYKYSLARYHEGWMMTGQAARLAISCGLHQIKSSVFKPSTIPLMNADLMGMMRHRVYCLPPTKDAVEHGERIWAFWAIFTCDRAGSISSQWPPAMPDEVITTPYPKPFYEYELGMVSEADDVSIASLYNPKLIPRPLPHYADTTLVIVRMKALALLEKSSKLMYLPPEPGWDASLPKSASVSPPGGIDEYLASQTQFEVPLDETGWSGSVEGSFYPGVNSQSSPGPTPGTSGHGWTRTAKIRTPKAYEEVRQALLRAELDLPPEWRVDWTVWDGKVQPWHYSGAPRKDLITLQFVLGCAWMFLFDVFSFNAENTEAVHVARRMAFTVKRLGNETMTSEIDVFIAMTWSFISKILIREVKRLQSVGDIAGAAVVEADVETLVSALKVFGQRYTISAMQAMRAERYRKSTWEEVKFMERDKHDEEGS